MNIFKCVALAGLLGGLALPFFGPAAAAGFVDVLDTPSLHSELAANGMLTGLAHAGERLVAVGQRGHILFSDDAGQHWQQAQVPVSSDLVAVHFPTPSQGWAVGHDGVILHSTDAGVSWERQLDARQIGALLLGHYRQQLIASRDDEALMARVADAQRINDEGADQSFLDVWFQDDQVGYVVGAFNLIFRTEDGGRHWTPWLDRTENPGALNLYALRPIGDQLFIVGEQGLVLKLDPLAGHFNATPMPYNGSFFGITGKPGAVLVYGLRGNVYRSVDEGMSWSKVELGLPLTITAGTVTADGRILLLSQAGHVLLSADNGASFTLEPENHLAPVSAALVSSSGALVVAGARGLRQLPFQ